VDWIRTESIVTPTEEELKVKMACVIKALGEKDEQRTLSTTK
jgi:hypothetical protein